MLCTSADVAIDRRSFGEARELIDSARSISPRDARVAAVQARLLNAAQ
jgi:hypothetical protein